MWTNSELKQRAKTVLSRFGYWIPFLATILCGLLMTDPSNILSVMSENGGLETLFENEEFAYYFSTVFLFFFVFSFFFNIFIGYPVLVGMNRFFMENRISGSKIERLFYVFKSGNYLKIGRAHV